MQFSQVEFVGTKKTSLEKIVRARKTFDECKNGLSEILKRSERKDAKVTKLIESVVSMKDDGKHDHKDLAAQFQMSYRLALEIFVNANSPNLEVKKALLVHLELPIDESVTSCFDKSITHDHVRILVEIEKKEMRENVKLFFPSGFEKQFDNKEENVGFEMQKEGNSCVINRYGKYDEEPYQINITEFDYAEVVTFEKTGFLKRVKNVFSGIFGPKMSSSSRTKTSYYSEHFASKKFQLTPRNRSDSDKRVINMVVKSTRADKQRRALFDSVGMKEIKYEQYVPGKELNLDIPKTLSREVVKVQEPEDGEYHVSVFDCMSVRDFKEVFDKYIQQLMGFQEEYRQAMEIFNRSSVDKNGKVITDDIFFQSKFMSQRKEFIRLFGSNEKLHGEITRLVNFELTEMNKSRKFYQKTYHFWTFGDVADWAKCVFTFSSQDTCFKNPIKLYDLLEKFISEIIEKYKYTSSEKLPFEILLEECSVILDENWKDFEDEMKFFMNPVYKKDLVKYLLYPKMIFHCQRITKPLADLLDISKIQDLKLRNKKLEDYNQKVANNRDYVQYRICKSVFVRMLVPLHEQIPFVESKSVEKAVKEISQGVFTSWKEKLEDYSDLDKIAKSLTEELKYSQKNDTMIMRLKLNCSSINSTIDVMRKLGVKVGQVFGIFGGKRIPFAFFHLSVSLRNVKLDWLIDDHVRRADIESKHIKASFDVGEFLIPIEKIPIILRFVLHWDQNERYHNQTNSCQHFSLKFIKMMYENFEPQGRKRDIRKLSVDTLFGGVAKAWVDEMMYMEKIERKIKINKTFVEVFPDIGEVDGVVVGSYFKFLTHADVYKIMIVFDSPEKYNTLKDKFPDELFLLKAFCRSFYFNERAENSKHRFLDCYFATSKENLELNKFGIDLSQV